MPCYTNMETWDRCAIKDKFTEYCRLFDVDVPEEYVIHDNMTEAELDAIDYPIIVKPVDRCSSIGISVCKSREELSKACQLAMNESNCKRIIAEKYIDNSGELFGVRYFVQDGEAFPYLMIDTYVVDPISRTGLVSGVTITPSKHAEFYMKNLDQKVRTMIKGMGITKGTVFFQALPYQGKIYFYEMGYRLSGGMLYKLTEPLMGINDMKMMIRSALGGVCITEEESARIDLDCNGKCGAQLMIPLNAGTIEKIEGLEEVKSIPMVTDFIQYYEIGDTIKSEFVGTLQQHFGRFTMTADSKSELREAIEKIQKILKILDEKGKQMNALPFDLSRLDRDSFCKT